MLHEKNKQPAIVLLLSLFLLELIRTAWIGDDAAITLRTVLNFLNGFGPTFNIDERVQAYTHPLWFFLISATSLIVRNVYAATFLLSIGASLWAVWILMTKVATNATTALVAGLALLLSKAYLDYATSGLENPLSHLLILAAVLMAVRSLVAGRYRDLVLFFLSCSLLYLNRPDLLALVFPLAVLVGVNAFRRSPGQLIRAVLISAAPVIGWTLFSIFYYGFPFPNTAYAKLGTGIVFHERLSQGGRYIMHSVNRDPLTIGFITAGIVLGLRGAALSRSLAIGVLLYLCYIMSIGGDFMEGRFFTAPLLTAAIIISRSQLERSGAYALGAGVLIVGLFNLHATLLSNASYTDTTIGRDGIADERGFYYQQVGLMSAGREMFKPPKWIVEKRSVEVVCGGLGYSSIVNGPGVHYIDNCALADPLLARLPAVFDSHWRIGHFVRVLPTGYRRSIGHGENLVTDPATKNYYDAIRSITRDRLSDPQRLQKIISFNLGKVPAPDWARYRNPPSLSPDTVIEADEVELARPVDGAAWNAPGNVQFGGTVEVILENAVPLHSIDLSVDNNDHYRVDALTPAGWREIAKIEPTNGIGMARHVIPVTVDVPEARRIRVTALSGDGLYSLGHLLVK